MAFRVNQQRWYWWSLSLAVILSGIIAMFISWNSPDIGYPLRPSIDFVGGTQLELERDCSIASNCPSAIDLGVVRSIVEEQGFKNAAIQVVGQQGITIRTKQDIPLDKRSQLQDALSQKLGKFDPKKTRIDQVGPIIGQQIFTGGLIALGLSFLGILVYLFFRFQLDYAMFAFVALFHDVLVTVGIFAILGLVQGVEVDSLFVVSLLTIIGYSVNDTVVIYDRIREIISSNANTDKPINVIVDDAVSQTLTRSINTTLTTLLSLISIFLFGGETLRYFALALIIGFLAGAYSSIFIASTLLSLWRERTNKVDPYTDNVNVT